MVKISEKALNLLKGGASFLKSNASGHPFIYALPPAIGVELTNCCNLNCPECTTGSGLMTRGKGFMEPDLYRKLMAELNPYLISINLYFQGEPMMHPDFPSFITGSGGARTIISTNGHFLSETNCIKLIRSGLYKLIVSIDGPDRESYLAYRAGGNLEIVLEGIRTLVSVRKRERAGLKIEIQVLINRYNEIKIPEIEIMCRSLNLPVRLKSMQILSTTEFEKWLPSKPQFRRYEEVDGNYILKNPLPNRCARLWFNPVVTWDGNILPCCFDKNGEHSMGNIYHESFNDIWYGPKYNLFRKMVLSDRKSIDICRNCTSGMKGISN